MDQARPRHRHRSSRHTSAHAQSQRERESSARRESGRALPPQCERDDRPPRPTRPRTAPALRLNILHVLLDGAVPCSRPVPRRAGWVRATSRGAARGRHDLTSTAPAPRDATPQDGGRAAGDSQSETTTLNALACTYHNDQHGYRTSTKYRGRPRRGGREHPREREECQEFRVTASRAQGPEHSLQPALDDLP